MLEQLENLIPVIDSSNYDVPLKVEEIPTIVGETVFAKGIKQVSVTKVLIKQ